MYIELREGEGWVEWEEEEEEEEGVALVHLQWGEDEDGKIHGTYTLHLSIHVYMTEGLRTRTV